jgi:dipeptidyl aminopeptidase/acylaminoacyl peptidase
MLLRRRGLLMGLGSFGLLGCGNAEAGNELQLRRTIPHPSNTDAKVEFFLQHPSTPGPQPTLILLHGNQPSLPSAGGRVFVQWGELERLSVMGFAVAAISLPGFGGSTGPKDFAGPFAQDAVGAVISHLEQTGIAKPECTTIQGISLGAVTGALLAAKDRRIVGLVLISGAYDLPSLFANQGRSGVAEVLAEFNRQTGGGEQARRERSALFQAAKIKAHTLILNGARDDRTDPAQAEQLKNAILAGGGQAESVIYPEFGHAIQAQTRQPRIDAFLAQFLSR